MNKVLIVLLSHTSAFSLKTMLEKRYKIHSRIIQAPARLATLGCSYCLELSADDARTAINLIKVSNITTKGVFSADTYERIF